MSPFLNICQLCSPQQRGYIMPPRGGSGNPQVCLKSSSIVTPSLQLKLGFSPTLPTALTADIFTTLFKARENVSLGKAASFIRRQILTFVIFSAVFLLFTIKYISPSSEYYWGMSNFFSAPFIILTNGCKIRQKIY